MSQNSIINMCKCFRLDKLSNHTPAMLGPKLSPPRNQNRVSRVIHLSPPA